MVFSCIAAVLVCVVVKGNGDCRMYIADKENFNEITSN